MKVDCVKRIIDINKVHWGIKKFRASKGEEPSYIVMNPDTAISFYDYFTAVFGEKESNFQTIFDIPVAYCRELEYGEIDVI